MTPHKSNKRGSYVLDRLFDGIGRIRRASGTRDATVFRQMDAMLTSLYGQGHHEVLRLLRERRIAPLAVWEAFRLKRIDRLPTGETMVALGTPPARRVRGAPIVTGEGVFAWVQSYITSPKGQADATSLWRTLIERGGVSSPMVADLPAMVRTYRTVCRTDRTPAMFNRVKAQVQAYLSDTLGASHPVYQLVSDVKGLTETGQRAPQPQTPEQMRALYGLLGRPLGEAAWAMAVTGMGPKEYWGAWEVMHDRIRILGTKREGRVRDVPLVYRIPRASLSRTKFEDDLAALTGGRVQPYDFRRTFAVWLVDAGIPANRRRHYRGHSPQSMGELYERVEIEHYLRDDANRLAAHVGSLPRLGLALEK